MSFWMVSLAALPLILHSWFAEILDFGYPQNSEIDTLKMYITTESIKSEMAVVCFYMGIETGLTRFSGKIRQK